MWSSFIARFAWRDLRASGRYLWVFWTSLMLGVALIAATGGLFKQVSDGLLQDTRALFGGDVEVRTRSPLGPTELAWMQERGSVSLLIELRTMLLAAGRPHLVELQSVDGQYPLYGTVALNPPLSVEEAVSTRQGVHGIAIDPILADRLNLGVGDRVHVGGHEVEVRALISRQPDRALNADWRGPPVLISTDALYSSGLVVPGSRLEFKYRARTQGDVDRWRDGIVAAFPESEFEVRTFLARRGRIAEVLGQIASGLLLIGFSALFVGGLGVFNSVRAYLASKLSTVATLRAIGLRDRQVVTVYLLQVVAVASAASLAGVAIGGLLSAAGSTLAASRVPISADPLSLLLPLLSAWVFGVLTACVFALPAIGYALSVTPAALFRTNVSDSAATPWIWWLWTAGLALVLAVAIVGTLPSPLFGLAFMVATLMVLACLELIVRIVKSGARHAGEKGLFGQHFALKLAVANLYRPGSPLRVTLLSLGSALTVLVASTLVVATLLQTIEQTIPDRAPALVFYDISSQQTKPLTDIVSAAPSTEAVVLAPLVLGRISHVNGEALRSSGQLRQALESRDEHKLSYRAGNIDDVNIERGAWWPPDYSGPPLVAFEDREADQLGLEVGDLLRFQILGQAVEARLAAIYAQRGIGTRFWFEGLFSDHALEAFITRYVGTAYMDAADALKVEAGLAGALPNVVTIRTDRILREARTMLGRAAGGLALIAALSLAASLLVLASVVAATKARQIYDATVLHALGARVPELRTALICEYVLVGLITSSFAIVTGGLIATALLVLRLKLDPSGVWWAGAAVAVVVSALSLGLGARSLLRALRLSPAALLRAGT